MLLRPAACPRSYRCGVDLSGVIFVALAIGWAVYLIPKALKHQDELALSRSVDSFSDSVRVLGKRPAPAPATPMASAAPEAKTPRYAVSRQAARKAARRRRRVLGLLLVVLLATVGTSYFAVTPWWSTYVSGGLVACFLVLARLTVRQQLRHARAAAPVAATASTPLSAEEMQPDLGREDTVGVSREELAAATAAPVTDADGLWDPVPVTLPTYVNKARARRTVRTIELTQGGVTSSGHDEADTALAREADEARKPVAPAAPPASERKVAGA